jgi:hypothetical protein
MHDQLNNMAITVLEGVIAGRKRLLGIGSKYQPGCRRFVLGGV